MRVRVLLLEDTSTMVVFVWISRQPAGQRIVYCKLELSCMCVYFCDLGLARNKDTVLATPLS